MNNLPSILTELRIPFKSAGEHHHAREGWIQFDCPNCSPGSHRYRLGVNVAAGYCNCWTCGHLSLVDMLAKLSKRPYGSIQDLLKGVAWRRVKKQEQPSGTLKLPRGIGPMQRPHRRYLQQRGLDPDAIERLWGVRGIGIASQFSWRLWIPIYRDGELVSWTTRSTGDGKGKRYIKAGPEEESTPAKQLLYGADYVRHSIVVCEGPIDAWAIGPGAVATMGLIYSTAQLIEMGKHPVRAICFDSEPAAQRRAHQLAKQLQAFPGETHVLELETGKDPAEASPDEVEKIRKAFLERDFMVNA